MRAINPQLIDFEKKKLRAYIKEQKKQFSLQDRIIQSNNIISQIEEHPDFVSAKTILAYWAMKDEVDLKDLILKWSNQKEFLLPCVNGEDLEIRKFSGIDSLKKGNSFDILEPIGEIFINYFKIDLILVPGVAFDLENNRMGRGKAYYDKFLPLTKSVKIGVCFDFQLVDTVPVTENDIKMDEIISIIK